MSSDLAIQLRGVGKAYRIYDRPADRLKQALWRGRRQYFREHWAVRSVDLDVRRGETLGIVGRNGSGKSTLLQMICGTLEPSCGDVAVHGRVAALLELGSGFNPEFTGRENIFMNALVLGLTQEETESRFDRIAAFADVGFFLDQPVKTYSSGMYARVAFATAINVDPDVLIVDEALSVGDEAFQRKCFGRIQEIRDAGATILFVSHSATTVVELCDRALLMDGGEAIQMGKPKVVVAQYQKLAYAPHGRMEALREEIKRDGSASSSLNETSGVKTGAVRSPSSVPLDDKDDFDPHLQPQTTQEYLPHGARISDVRIENEDGRRVNILTPGHDYIYRYRVVFDSAAFNVRVGMMIRTVSGVEVAGMTSHPQGEGIDFVEAGQTLDVSLRFRNLFNPQVYFVNAGVVGTTDGQEIYLHRVLDAAMFRSQPQLKSVRTGLVDLRSGDWNCRIKPLTAPLAEKASGDEKNIQKLLDVPITKEVCA